ncbi:MAG: hypothetical protein IPJ00_10840 [Saprospirales bacterium]|nr:hypothetical protein [Saprospirales bacterium]
MNWMLLPEKAYRMTSMPHGKKSIMNWAEKKPLNDDDFLKAHWIMTFMYSRKKGDDYINFLLNEYFTPKNIHKKIEKEVVIAQVEETRTEFEFADDEPENGEDETRTVTISALEPKRYVSMSIV